MPGHPQGSAYESTQAGLTFQSDWARNELKGSLIGGYADYFNAHQANAPNASGTIDGRLDVTRDLSLDSEARLNIATQTAGSVTLPTGVVLSGNARPLIETYGATLGGAQKFGDLTLSLHGTLDRTSLSERDARRRIDRRSRQRRFHRLGIARARGLSDQPGHFSFRRDGDRHQAL